eukprot:tig00001181_g7422.t1
MRRPVIISQSEKYVTLKTQYNYRPGILFNVCNAMLRRDLAILTADLRIDGTFCSTTYHVRPKDAAAAGPVSDATLNALQDELVEIVEGRVNGLDHLPDNKTHVVIDVSCKDRDGLLSELAGAITGLGLDIESAKIFTHKGMVLDTFFVTEGGQRVAEDKERFTRIKERLAAASGDPEARVNISSHVLEAVMSRREEVELARRRSGQPSPRGRERETDDRFPARDFVFAQQEANEINVMIDDASIADFILVKIHCETHEEKLLAEMARLMAELGLQIHKLKYSWKEGGRPQTALDMYITDATHVSELDVDMRARLRRLIISAILSPEGQAELHHTATIEAAGEDRPGLLKDMTTALKRMGVSITHATCTTTGAGRVRNTLCVADAEGQPILDTETLSRIQESVNAACEGSDSSPVPRVPSDTY